MNYVSTRNNKITVTSAQAIAGGISKEGGLFVPQEIPKLSANDFNKLREMSYPQRAQEVLGRYLTDFSEQELKKCVEGAYLGNFDDDKPAPISKLGSKINMLELWHGPTCAFKDLALQILPYLLTTAAKKVGDGKETVILVATSGDTGKAALEGFADVDNTKIIVFYPEDGVSPMQKLQMNTQNGNNVMVCAINGNFDDAQTGVKKIFTDISMKQKLENANMNFSSANSINWGRLAPQIVYYISAYCDMLESGDDLTDGFNIVVPTGNFGNILAAYYAKKMGVPVNRLICASNSNNVLTDFIKTGTYDRNREFYTTISPSMDILISSNLERMLYEFCKHDSETVAELQRSLSENGKFTVRRDIHEKFNNIFYGGCCDDNTTKETIKNIFEKYGYLCDTHTAVAIAVYEKYLLETGDGRPVVIASTASPYKFAKSVLSALDIEADKDEFTCVETLSNETNTSIPAPICALKTAEIRFSNTCEKEDMSNIVLNYLEI